MLRPMSEATDATVSPEAVARRRAVHERELRARRRWTIVVAVTSFSMLGFYLYLLFGIRVEAPFYLVVNLLATITGLCSVLVYQAYHLPTILAELPRLSEQDRRINLAAIEPIRAELLANVLPSLGLARRREEAAALDDKELVRRLAGLQRPDWRKIARNCLIAWIVGMSIAAVGIATYRPPLHYGGSLLERFQAKKP
jgi:hypothetical protein